MESFSINSDKEKRSSAIRALILEVLVMVTLIVTIVIVLNYFNIINIATFVPFKLPLKQNQSSSLQPTPAQNIGTAKSNTAKQKALYEILKEDDAINYARTEIEYKGILKVIDRNNGKFFDATKKTNEEYALKIVISAGKSRIPLTSYFSNAGLGKIEVYSKLGDSKPVKMNIEDLKPNDNIILNLVNSTIDDYPNDLIQAIITKVTP